MSYGHSSLGLGAGGSGSIELGRLAKRDPILAFSSTMASSLLRQASVRPARARLGWLRGELNKVQPGMGATFVSKARELQRRGRGVDQAMFDALRLTLANQFATAIAKRSMSGLGESSGDIDSVFCGMIGLTTAAGTLATSFENPSASGAVGTAGANAMLANGCNASALAAQAAAAEANNRAAQANAEAGAAAAATDADKTVKLVAIGGGVVVLIGLLGVIALK